MPLALLYPTQGLSPRVRGNPVSPDNFIFLHGSIPACAGEPLTGLHDGFSFRVYPRVCGGTLIRIYFRLGGWGLSPRVRGNQLHSVSG